MTAITRSNKFVVRNLPLLKSSSNVNQLRKVVIEEWLAVSSILDSALVFIELVFHLIKYAYRNCSLHRTEVRHSWIPIHIHTEVRHSWILIHTEEVGNSHFEACNSHFEACNHTWACNHIRPQGHVFCMGNTSL
jgi:hypothetical protein